MSNTGAIQEFAVAIGLLTVAEARALHEEYRSMRPDIFDSQR